MERLKIYRIALIAVLFFNLIMLCFSYLYDLKNGIPDSLKVYVDHNSQFDFSVPVEADVEGSVEALSVSNAGDIDGKSNKIHFTMNEPFVVNSSKTGQYDVELKLFGMFTLKKVSLDVIDEVKLTPCGNAIGIHVNMDGLLVLGTGAVTGEDGLEHEPAYQIIQTGDYITGVNGKKVKSIKGLQKRLQAIDSDYAALSIRRNGMESDVRVPAVKCQNGEVKIGVWVREDTQGIGTLTFVSEKGKFAALGHGITDSDTGVLLELRNGSLYNTEIIQIVKGTSGKPGEIMGMILESPSQLVGNIKKNTSLGISGSVSDIFDIKSLGNKSCPVALRQDIKLGKATILCQLGKKISEYNIKIIDIDRGSTDNKGLVIEITDDKLLKKTGGIIQGMSGAPILQDGKLVGAITHVFVNEPTKGYGIFAETMLEH